MNTLVTTVPGILMMAGHGGAERPSPALTGRPAIAATGKAGLTPSEVVYLSGASFVAAGNLLTGYTLPGSDVRVKKDDLSARVLAAAFLALEIAGELSLAVRSRKTLLGTAQDLYADPAGLPPGTPGSYPDESLETSLLFLAERQCADGGKNEVWRIVHRLIPECIDPATSFLDQVRAYLAERGLLQVTRTTKFGLLRKTKFEVPESTARLAAERVGEVQALFDACQEARPDVWEKLLQDIGKGIANSRKSDGPDLPE